MTINAHKEASRALASAARFLVFATDHHDRAALADATPDQVRVRRGQAASDIAEATKHLGLAAMWIAHSAFERER